MAFEFLEDDEENVIQPSGGGGVSSIYSPVQRSSRNRPLSTSQGGAAPATTTTPISTQRDSGGGGNLIEGTASQEFLTPAQQLSQTTTIGQAVGISIGALPLPGSGILGKVVSTGIGLAGANTYMESLGLEGNFSATTPFSETAADALGVLKSIKTFFSEGMVISSDVDTFTPAEALEQGGMIDTPTDEDQRGRVEGGILGQEGIYGARAAGIGVLTTKGVLSDPYLSRTGASGPPISPGAVFRARLEATKVTEGGRLQQIKEQAAIAAANRAAATEAQRRGGPLDLTVSDRRGTGGRSLAERRGGSFTTRGRDVGAGSADVGPASDTGSRGGIY